MSKNKKSHMNIEMISQLDAMGFDPATVRAAIQAHPEMTNLDEIIDVIVSGDVTVPQSSPEDSSGSIRTKLMDMGFATAQIDQALAMTSGQDLQMAIDTIMALVADESAPTAPRQISPQPEPETEPTRRAGVFGFFKGRDKGQPSPKRSRTGNLNDTILREERSQGGFNVGGGLQVAPEPSDDMAANIDDIMSRAEKAGLTQPTPAQSTAFTGTGRSTGGRMTHNPAPPKPIELTLTMFSNGMEAGGRFIPADSPEATEIMERLREGHVPPSLVPENAPPGTNVDVKVVRRVDEEYAPESSEPARPAAPFSGAARSFSRRTPAPAPAPKKSFSHPEPIVLQPGQPVQRFKVRRGPRAEVVTVNPDTLVNEVAGLLEVGQLTCMMPKMTVDLTDGRTVTEAGLVGKMWTIV